MGALSRKISFILPLVLISAPSQAGSSTDYTCIEIVKTSSAQLPSDTVIREKLFAASAEELYSLLFRYHPGGAGAVKVFELAAEDAELRTKLNQTLSDLPYAVHAAERGHTLRRSLTEAVDLAIAETPIGRQLALTPWHAIYQRFRHFLKSQRRKPAPLSQAEIVNRSRGEAASLTQLDPLNIPAEKAASNLADISRRHFNSRQFFWGLQDERRNLPISQIPKEAIRLWLRTTRKQINTLRVRNLELALSEASEFTNGTIVLGSGENRFVGFAPVAFKIAYASDDDLPATVALVNGPINDYYDASGALHARSTFKLIFPVGLGARILDRLDRRGSPYKRAGTAYQAIKPVLQYSKPVEFIFPTGVESSIRETLGLAEQRIIASENDLIDTIRNIVDRSFEIQTFERKKELRARIIFRLQLHRSLEDVSLALNETNRKLWHAGYLEQHLLQQYEREKKRHSGEQGADTIAKAMARLGLGDSNDLLTGIQWYGLFYGSDHWHQRDADSVTNQPKSQSSVAQPVSAHESLAKSLAFRGVDAVAKQPLWTKMMVSTAVTIATFFGIVNAAKPDTDGDIPRSSGGGAASTSDTSTSRSSVSIDRNDTTANSPKSGNLGDGPISLNFKRYTPMDEYEPANGEVPDELGAKRFLLDTVSSVESSDTVNLVAVPEIVDIAANTLYPKQHDFIELRYTVPVHTDGNGNIPLALDQNWEPAAILIRPRNYHLRYDGTITVFKHQLTGLYLANLSPNPRVPLEVTYYAKINREKSTREAALVDERLANLRRDKILDLATELEQARMTDLAKAIREFTIDAEKVSVTDLEQIFATTQSYSYSPARVAPGLSVSRFNKFIRWTKFRGADGELYYQCNGANTLFPEFLRLYFEGDVSVHVSPLNAEVTTAFQAKGASIESRFIPDNDWYEKEVVFLDLYQAKSEPVGHRRTLLSLDNGAKIAILDATPIKEKKRPNDRVSFSSYGLRPKRVQAKTVEKRKTKEELRLERENHEKMIASLEAARSALKSDEFELLVKNDPRGEHPATRLYRLSSIFLNFAKGEIDLRALESMLSKRFVGQRYKFKNVAKLQNFLLELSSWHVERWNYLEAQSHRTTAPVWRYSEFLREKSNNLLDVLRSYHWEPPS